MRGTPLFNLLRRRRFLRAVLALGALLVGATGAPAVEAGCDEGCYAESAAAVSAREACGGCCEAAVSATDDSRPESPASHDDGPACPCDCRHCPHRCCGGPTIALPASLSFLMAWPALTSVAAPADVYPSTQADGVFRPPRG